jgi:hypothetical protein
MHEFRADRDHAMRNIQKRTIPVVQLTQRQQLSPKSFTCAGVLYSLQECQVLQYKSGSTGNGSA